MDILTEDDGPNINYSVWMQWESRFIDGGNITGLSWVVLLGGMERGKFLPSISSLIGLRTIEGFEMNGPNLTLVLEWCLELVLLQLEEN